LRSEFLLRGVDDDWLVIGVAVTSIEVHQSAVILHGVTFVVPIELLAIGYGRLLPLRTLVVDHPLISLVLPLMIISMILSLLIPILIILVVKRLQWHGHMIIRILGIPFLLRVLLFHPIVMGVVSHLSLLAILVLNRLLDVLSALVNLLRAFEDLGVVIGVEELGVPAHEVVFARMLRFKIQIILKFLLKWFHFHR